MNHFSHRLGLISSPVVRSQLLMQISQLIDMAFLGDTSSEHERELLDEIDSLTVRLAELEGTALQDRGL